MVDHQEGLYQLVRDRTPTDVKSSILAHAALGKIFNLPTILTTSAETGTLTPSFAPSVPSCVLRRTDADLLVGPNGLLPAEVIAMHPTAPYIKRHGEVNAWDNPDFRAAVEATGKKQVIIAGITTDVCTAFLALSLVEAGYTVFANSDASGTFDAKTASEANDRMRAAGVQVLSMFAVALELMRDWRSTPGTPEMMPFFDQ